MLKLNSEPTKFNFMRWHKLTIGIALAGILGTIVLLSTIGLNLGTDFAGGILMEVQTPQAKDLSALRDELNTLELGNINLQQLGNEDQVLIRIGPQPGENGLQKAVQSVKDKIGSDAEYRRVEFVGPQVGQELIHKGIWAVILSSLGILAFIMMRFRLEFGICAVIALLHDTLLTVGLFTITRAEFDLSTLAAVLMIGGYSINDTVVVFDRVREMMGKYRKMPLPELFNLSINATLSRTILTGGTAILALVALWFLGGSVIRGFVSALIWGIVVGTYSSVFVATPLLMYLGLNKDHKQRLTENR
jgi:preprotein translocase subunit SecF